MDDLWSRYTGENFLSVGGVADWVPALNISETDGEIHVRAEIPGLEAKDIDVSISGDVLTLKGEKKEEMKKEDENFVTRERYSGMFQRSVRLSSEVQGDGAQANFKNGVLTVKLPKSEKTGTKNIDVRNA
jgi:HSP20 family protein